MMACDASDVSQMQSASHEHCPAPPNLLLSVLQKTSIDTLVASSDCTVTLAAEDGNSASCDMGSISSGCCDAMNSCGADYTACSKSETKMKSVMMACDASDVSQIQAAS